MSVATNTVSAQPSAVVERAREIDQALSAMAASERFTWLAKNFGGDMLLSSSLGLQAAVMLDLAAKHAPELPIVFIDTGYHFKETYDYLSELQEHLGIELDVFTPKLTAAFQEARWGKLWEQGELGHKRYHLINKIEPMDRALKTYGASIWLSGIRRSQASTRQDRSFAEAQNGTIKVYPILDWSDEDVENYLRERKLPRHPLQSEGYVTMGDWHSTRAPEIGQEREETRFNGNQYECGLHLESGSNDFQI